MAKKQPLRLLSPAEVKDLAPRIDEAFERRLKYGEDASADLYSAGTAALFGAWAASAALCDDVEQLDAIVFWLQHRDLHHIDEVATLAAIRLAGTDPERRARLYPLAARQAYMVVHHIVDWLDPTNEAERAVLVELSESKSDTYAKLARTRLAAFGALSWWQGAFDEDPTTGLDPDALRQVLPKLKRFAQVVAGTEEEESDEDDDLDTDDEGAEAEGESSGDADDDSEGEAVEEVEAESEDDEPASVLDLLRSLPARAQLAAALPLVRHPRDKADLGQLIGLVLEHEEGPRRLCDLLVKLDLHEGYEIDRALEELPDGIPVERRLALCREALRRLQGLGYDAANETRSPNHHLVCAIVYVWPVELSPEPVVEQLLAWGDPEQEKPEGGCGYWSMVFKRVGPAHTSALMPHFRAALANGLGGRYRILGPSLDDLADTWPAEVRHELAAGVMQAPAREASRRWAVKTFVELEPEFVVQRFGTPDVRAAAFQALDGAVLLHARAELRRGRVTVVEASQILRELDQLWGGVAAFVFSPFEKPFRRRRRERGDGLREDEETEARRQKLAALGKPELLGPPTDDEWAEFRRLRAGASWEELDRGHWTEMFVPTGPWTAEDLAWMERVVARTRDHEPDHADFVARLLAKHVCPEILPLVERLEGLGDEDRQEGVEEILAGVRQRLGLAEEDEAPDAAAGDDDW